MHHVRALVAIRQAKKWCFPRTVPSRGRPLGNRFSDPVLAPACCGGRRSAGGEAALPYFGVLWKRNRRTKGAVVMRGGNSVLACACGVVEDGGGGVREHEEGEGTA